MNDKNALNRPWRTTTIDRMLSNYIYAGDYQHRKRIKDEEQYYLKMYALPLLIKMILS